MRNSSRESPKISVPWPWRLKSPSVLEERLSAKDQQESCIVFFLDNVTSSFNFCRATLDTSVSWQNDSSLLRTRDVEAKSHGRVSIDMTNALIIRNLTTYDAVIYTCWYNQREMGTFTLIGKH
jgi:hypothetical protein